MSVIGDVGNTIYFNRGNLLAESMLLSRTQGLWGSDRGLEELDTYPRLEII